MRTHGSGFESEGCPMKDSDLRGITTEGLIEELERRQVSFEKYKEMGSWIAREKELVHFREILQQIEDEGSGHGQALARIALKGSV
jgi:hypothetical protein